MKRLLLALLLIPALAGAQDFQHRYFHYNQYYDAAVPFTITANTADGADTNAISISGGGAATAGRGPWMTLSGADTGGANVGGDITFHATNDTYDTTFTFDYITTSQTTPALTIASAAAADAHLMAKFINNKTASSGDVKIYTASDASGGSIVFSGVPTFTSGAVSGLVGEYGAGGRGAAAIDVANGEFRIWTAYRTANAQQRLAIPATADNDDVELLLGVATTTAPIFTIRGQTADTDDDGVLNLTGGGAASSSRGSYLALYANEAGAPGDVFLVAGNVSGGDVTLQATAANGGINFSAVSLDRWALQPNGDFAQNATNGGNIVMAKNLTGIQIGDALHADAAAVIGSSPVVYASGNSAQIVQITSLNTEATADPTFILGMKTRSTAGDADTIVQNNDGLFRVQARGADGALYKIAGQIDFEVDGTPGSSDMPGRIVFKTTPDGSATPAEALRITSQGTTLVKGVAVASLPASCAPGSLIRATDSNDCAAAGGDGAMCICAAAGTWALAHNY